MAFCNKCGSQVNEGATFCTSCGQPIESNSQKQSGGAGIPTFTPPTPTFTPPTNTKPTFNGPACSYHKDEPAVAKCAKCGRYICQDCFDNYGVSGGEYAGKALCYDCCQKLVAANVEDLKKNKRSIVVTFVFTLVGMLLGGIFGASAGADSGSVGMTIFIGMCIGGCFWTFLKGWIARISGAVSGGGCNGMSIAIGLVLGFFIEAILSIVRTIKKVIECIVYLKRTSGFIESDSAALQQMADYMEYTMIRNQNRGVDIETLLNQKSELADNAYAQMVRSQGEDAAEANLRGCVASINENGEIIRNFAA